MLSNTKKKFPLKCSKESMNYVITLVITFLALSLIVGLTFGSFYATSKKDATTIGKMSVTEEAIRISDRLLLGYNTLQVSSLTIDHMITQNIAPADIESYLKTESEEIKRDIDPSFSSVYGVVKGKYIDGDGTDWVPNDYNPYTRDWYIYAKANKGKLTIVPPYVDAQTGSIIISFSRLLSDGESVISLDKKMDEIYEAARKVQVNGYGYCFVLDESGLVVAHRNEGEKGKNYLTDEGSNEEVRKLTQNVLSTESGVWETKVDGQKCMIFAQSVQSSWHLILVVNSRDLYKANIMSLIRNIFISLAIFVLLGFFCTLSYQNRKKALRFASEVRIDKLTGLNNRGEFDRYMLSINESFDEGKKYFLILFDIDDFKAINDKFGHTEGDKALHYYAQIIKNVSDETGSFCARYGGDEFVVVTSGGSYKDAEKTALTIGERLLNTEQELNLAYSLAISYGIAEYCSMEQNIPELIDTADQGLYRMKQVKKTK